MTNPQAEVEVFRYAHDVREKGAMWTYDGHIRLRFVEGNAAHPHAIEIVNQERLGSMIVPAHELIKAVEWMKRCLP